MKKLYSVILIMALAFGGIINVNSTVKASDTGQCIDGSYLSTGDSSEVTVGSDARGIYLRSGSSSMVKAGTGRITAGGTTVAQKIVSDVSITVRVERLVNGRWQIYTSWSATRYNAGAVSTSKTLSVPTGYYYRTHSIHSANSDSSSSASSGLWI